MHPGDGRRATRGWMGTCAESNSGPASCRGEPSYSGDVSVDYPTTPTLAALRRARARQEAAARWLRPLSLVVALLVIARAFRGTPAPSGHGTGLGVSVALAAIAVGAAGVLATYRVPGRIQLACCALFLAGSAALFWLQPGGAGLFGALVAVGVMTRWLPFRLSVLPVAATV